MEERGVVLATASDVIKFKDSLQAMNEHSYRYEDLIRGVIDAIPYVDDDFILMRESLLWDTVHEDKTILWNSCCVLLMAIRRLLRKCSLQIEMRTTVEYKGMFRDDMIITIREWECNDKDNDIRVVDYSSYTGTN